MNYKKLLFFSFHTASFLLLFAGQAFSQVANPKENYENIYQHWFFALDKFRSDAGVNSADYVVFSRFSEKRMDSLRSDFINKIGAGKVTLANAKEYENVLVTAINTIYAKFEKIKQLYPSSVDEFKNYRAPMLSQICDSGCDNINFASGDLSAWYAYYGVNESSTTANVITNITGGLAGAVTEAANDALTSTPGYYNGGLGPNPSPDYQVKITSGSLHDAIVPSIPEVSPFGGNYSVMLGDSSQVNYGVAMLSQTFKVSSSNANFTYQYAVVLANPNHNYYQQPLFTVAVLDQSGDTIPFCGEYSVVSGNGIPGFQSIFYTDTYPNGSQDTFHVFYKNWTIVNVPLTRYIGQCVTVVFQVVDCALGGHFGYAYVDASCAPLSIISSSPNFCGQDSITLTGPAGEGHYSWTGPNGGIRGSNDTLRQINVDSAGTYTLIITPFTGATCNDTMTIKIGKAMVPPPHPNFSGDTGCIGTTTAFLNTSNPLGGASFYWDFYNNGTFEDSTVNAMWKYNQTGVYQVKLQEIYNGCGMDTVINVVIDSVSKSSFVADTVCFRDTTQFKNTSSGGITYYWNFGDPPTGSNNSSVNVNPGHSFSAPGTYTVALIAKHPDWCNDTVKQTVVVLPLPVATITGSDSICLGQHAVLTAGGGITYLWSTGDTTSSINVVPYDDSTFTVTVSNGICSNDTTYTVYIRPVLSGTVTATNVCLNDTVHLTAKGGGTYLWSNGATTSSISVLVTSMNDSTFYVNISKGNNDCHVIGKTITIYPLPFDSVCCNDTIYEGDSVVLSGTSGGSKYYWIPPTGLSCDTCPNPIASPTTTTAYTLVTESKNGCYSDASLLVDVKIPCDDFFVPNVFTPNGDGINDTYLIKVKYMAAYQISIYNRWGKRVFNSSDPDSPWNGNINGSPAAAGVYYYIIQATCFDGNFFKKDGYLQLIRGGK